jgi:hypothetical protein
MLLIAELIMLSKEYLETARTVFRVARNMADQTIANRLKALAEGYDRRAEQASHSDAANDSALRAGAASRKRSGRGRRVRTHYSL